MFEIVAEPNRRAILTLLVSSQQSVGEIERQLRMPLPTVSNHLRVLREAGLVNVERDPLDARWVYYSINGGRLAEFSRVFGRFFDLEHIKPRRQTCGPGSAFVPLDSIIVDPGPG